MKTILLSVLTALATLNVNAQNINSDTGTSLKFIPAIFSCNGETIIYEKWRDDDHAYHAKIINGPLSGTQFRTGDYGEYFSYFDLDNGIYFPKQAYLTVTQNLFNDDEYFEWLTSNSIDSSNGTSIELPQDCDRGPYEIYKINGQYYLYGSSGGDQTLNCHLYLIKSETASIETVPADAPEARLVYSLNGHRQNDMQQGINIITGGENGPRKVLKR